MNDIKNVIRVEHKSADDASYSMPIVISSGNVDRDGDILVPSGADVTGYLKTGGLLLINHWSDGQSLKNVIGKITDIKVVDNELRGVATWHVGKGNTEADWAYFLAREGQASFSHWFRPKITRDVTDEEKAAGVNIIITEWDILEISQVMVPANPDAIVVTASKFKSWKNRNITKFTKQIGENMEVLLKIAEALGLTIAPEATEEEIITAILDAIAAMRGEAPATQETDPASGAEPAAPAAPAASAAPPATMTSVTKQGKEKVSSSIDELRLDLKRLEGVIQSMAAKSIDNEIEEMIKNGIIAASSKSFATWLKSHNAKQFDEWKKTLSVMNTPKPKSGNREITGSELVEAVAILDNAGISKDDVKRMFPNAFNAGAK